MKQMESSLTAKEKIYKERIRGLEQQVGVLKEQLSKEMRRRQVFISGKTITLFFQECILEMFFFFIFAGTAGISKEMSELRQNLDQSLFNVSSTGNMSNLSPGSPGNLIMDSPKLDAALLERETNRLSGSVDKYGREYVERLTPSRLLASSSAAGRGVAGSVDNLYKTSTPNNGGSKRTLSNESYTTKRTLSFNQDV